VTKGKEKESAVGSACPCSLQNRERGCDGSLRSDFLAEMFAINHGLGKESMVWAVVHDGHLFLGVK
jgi:hypothetical protein